MSTLFKPRVGQNRIPYGRILYMLYIVYAVYAVYTLYPVHAVYTVYVYMYICHIPYGRIFDKIPAKNTVYTPYIYIYIYIYIRFWPTLFKSRKKVDSLNKLTRRPQNWMLHVPVVYINIPPLYVCSLLMSCCITLLICLCSFSSMLTSYKGWPDLSVHTVYDRMFGDSSAKDTVYTPYTVYACF
jgi:hypothetical protein